MEKSRVRWSDLPPQLWPLIGKCLDNYIDIVRFRSVCRSWRASLPQLDAISLLSPLLVPHPFDYRTEGALVIRRTICGTSPLHHHQTSISPSSSRASAGWLAKIETTNHGKMRFLTPLSTHWVKSRNRVFQKEVNLLDFRIQEVAKSYMLRSTIGGILLINKVVIFPDSAWMDVKNFIIVAVNIEGKLGFTKFGDYKWTLISSPNFQFADLIVYKGKIYTVDRLGTVFLIDPSMKLVQISPELGVISNQKHLIECAGEIYVLDRFLEQKKDPELLNSYFFGEPMPRVVDFKVQRLDQEIMGRSRWVEVKNLGKHSFVLGHNCFSVLAADFEGFKENCIYFCDELQSDLGYGFSTHVFDLEERKIVKASPKIFWAPPIWVRS